ncbi:MAG: LVIVD repeat-containing protein [Candidatus Heimdallarchaeota archaeon]
MIKSRYLQFCCFFTLMISPVLIIQNSQGTVQNITLNKVGEIDVGKSPFTIRKSPNILIVGDSGSGSSPGSCVSPDATGISLIDVTDPSEPRILDQFYDGGQPHGIVIIGNTLFLADHCDGLEIYDITNPNAVTEIGEFSDFQLAHDLKIKGNYAFVADYRTGLVVLDVTDHNNISLVSNYTDTGPIYHIEMIGETAYVSHSLGFEGKPDFSLILLDITDPLNITEIARYDIKANSIAASGDIAYIAADSSGLLVYNTSNPSELRELGSYQDVGRLMDLVLNDNLVFTTDFENNKLIVFNVTDPTDPQYASSYTSVGQTLALDLDENYAYITNFPNGIVEIIQYNRDYSTAPTSATSGFEIVTLIGIALVASQIRKNRVS